MFIFYGSKEIQRDKFIPVKNWRHHTDFQSIQNNGFFIYRPYEGGLYSCRLEMYDQSYMHIVDSPITSPWKRFCLMDNGLKEKNVKDYVIFNLLSSAKIFKIDGARDVLKLIHQYKKIDEYKNPYLDWEEMSKKYDGIEITHDGLEHMEKVSMTTWDVPTLLLFNIDCIKVFERGK